VHQFGHPSGLLGGNLHHRLEQSQPKGRRMLGHDLGSLRKGFRMPAASRRR
jgi:hypothetical protein